jgi:hypothetical protein
MIRESDVYGLVTDLGTKITNPLTTTGDIIYSSSGSTPARLAIGAANTVLHGGTTPSYSGIAITDLTATGTPSSSTYLRGDNTWATISGGGITSVTNTGTYENATISGSTINIPNLWPRVWNPLGTVMTADLVADASNIQEPCVLYEGNPGESESKQKITTYKKDTPKKNNKKWLNSLFLTTPTPVRNWQGLWPAPCLRQIPYSVGFGPLFRM